MPRFPSKTATILSFLALSAAIGGIHYGVARHESSLLLSLYILAFGCYGYLQKQQLSWQKILFGGLILRFLLLFGLPTLSDDFYRFIWDGKLILEGISPYAALPHWYLENAPLMPTTLYEKLNSPEYFTVYPPLSQAIFLASVYIGQSLEGSVLMMRLFILTGEIACFFMLKKLCATTGEQHNLSLYFFNPLVILELTGNLHFEGIMLLWLLLALYFFQKKQMASTGITLGLGVATKLLPLMALPAFVFRTSWKKFMLLLLALVATVSLSFYPFFDQNILTGMHQSLDLFVRKFEFNGSIYYIFRAIGYWKRGFNMIAAIGPMMMLLSGTLIFSYAYWKRKSALQNVLMNTWMIYLAFALVVHPWYIIPMIGLSVLTKKRYPIVWSGLIFTTYVGYSSTGYEPMMWLIFLEYAILLGYILWENFIQKIKPHA